jgi:hypothetical protein
LKKSSLLTDPLTHFVVLGALVFTAYQLLNPSVGPDPERVIVVDEPSLVEFVQYRSKQFDEQQALKRLRGMSGTAMTELIDEFVAEEALYRSAKRFGLEADDYVIRRRLVQKMDFMAEGVITPDSVVDDAVLQQFYANNHKRYFKPATVTFTHVFYGAQQRGTVAAQALAAATLVKLQKEAVTFTQAPQFGERFAYQLNYVERPQEEVADHFGEAMAGQLLALPVAANRWVGPLESTHGSHLVLVTNQQAGYQPEFSQVAAAVRQDYLAKQQQDLRRSFAQEIINTYELRIDPQLSGKTAS